MIFPHTIRIWSMLFYVVILNELSAQNIAISTDGSAAETGVILDVKGTNSIGTTAIQNVFQVKSFDASGSELKLRMILGTHATAGSRYAALEVYDAGAPAYRNLSLQPSGGYVGIGLTNPARLLHLQSSNAVIRIDRDADSPGILFTRTAGGSFSTVWKTFSMGTTATGVNNGTFDINDLGSGVSGAGTPRITINNVGYVGISASVPSARLQVGTTSSDGRANGIQLGDAASYKYNIYQQTGLSGSIQNSIVIDANGDVDLRQTLGTNNGSGHIVFMTGAGTANGGTGVSTEKMRINSIGNVGIGTVAPSTKALLEMSSTTKGLLTPRMTNAQRGTLETNGTADAANAGLMIYQTDVGTVAPTGIGYYYWDGTYWTGIGSNTSSTSSNTFNYNNNFQLFDDFHNTREDFNPAMTTLFYNEGFLGWTVETFNVSVALRPKYSNSTQTAAHPGTCELGFQSSNGTNSLTSLSLPNLFPGNTPNVIMEVSAKVNTTSGNVGSLTAHDRRIGLANAFDIAVGDGEQTNGIYFRTIANGNWFAVTRSGGVETATATGVAQGAAGTWRKFKIISTGTSVTFYIDGALVATNSTNIPTTELRPGVEIRTKTTYPTIGAGTAAYYLYLDYFMLNIGGLSR